jgi:hypothetical protein
MDGKNIWKQFKKSFIKNFSFLQIGNVIILNSLIILNIKQLVN